MLWNYIHDMLKKIRNKVDDEEELIELDIA